MKYCNSSNIWMAYDFFKKGLHLRSFLLKLPQIWPLIHTWRATFKGILLFRLIIWVCPHCAMQCTAELLSLLRLGRAGSQIRNSTAAPNRRNAANIQTYLHTDCLIDMKVQSELAQDPARHHTTLCRRAFRIQTILWNSMLTLFSAWLPKETRLL